MASWLLETTREPARALVRGVAGALLAAAVSSFFWAGHLGLAILTVFWALVLMGPVLAWPLTWGPLLGRGSFAIGVLLVILPGYFTNNTAGDTALMIGLSIPFFLIGVLFMVPQHIVGLAHSLIRR
jgi:hypothetical protein